MLILVSLRAVLAKFHSLWGFSCLVSFLKTIHQSLILLDQLWTSLSSATLNFEKPQYQFSESLHVCLQEERSR
jgi:hypothetical protein